MQTSPEVNAFDGAVPGATTVCAAAPVHAQLAGRELRPGVRVVARAGAADRALGREDVDAAARRFPDALDVVVQPRVLDGRQRGAVGGGARRGARRVTEPWYQANQARTPRASARERRCADRAASESTVRARSMRSSISVSGGRDMTRSSSSAPPAPYCRVMAASTSGSARTAAMPGHGPAIALTSIASRSALSRMADAKPTACALSIRPAARAVSHRCHHATRRAMLGEVPGDPGDRRPLGPSSIGAAGVREPPGGASTGCTSATSAASDSATTPPCRT